MSRYVFFISGGAVAWFSRKQVIVTLSRIEAEFIAAIGCACQGSMNEENFERIGACTKRQHHHNV